MAKKNVKALMEERRKALIEETWPNLEAGTTWDRRPRETKGFTTIPRCMSFCLDIMDQLSSGNPLSSVYFTLWCHASDEGFIQVKNEQYMAFEAGLKGQRRISTWRLKMKKLRELGFIISEAGASGDFSFILIVNPYRVVKTICKASTATESLKRSYRTLVERAGEIGAKDLKD